KNRAAQSKKHGLIAAICESSHANSHRALVKPLPMRDHNPMNASTLSVFRSLLSPSAVISTAEELQTYECDALTNYRVLPCAVLLPTSTEQVQSILRICHREKIPFVARGSGTGLSGGALPIKDGIVISFARMNRILEIDLPNARAVVEPGVINLD